MLGFDNPSCIMYGRIVLSMPTGVLWWVSVFHTVGSGICWLVRDVWAPRGETYLFFSVGIPESLPSLSYGTFLMR